MTFNYEKDGYKVAVINSEKRQKKVYFSESDDGYDEINLKEGQFMLSPDKHHDERQTVFCFGSAGSGKSYWVSSYVSEYHKVHPKNAIYLISEQDEDKSFDSKDFIKRIDISDMGQIPLEWKEFQECLVIFDDIDSISNKKLSNAVELLRDQLLKNARKFKVSVISTSHEGCEGKKTKAVLNESRVIVFFPRNFNRSLKYLMESYLGLDKKCIEKIKQSKSRWCAYVKAYPCYLVEEKRMITIPKLSK
jgi:DNA-directed RNA polymerase beta subunit